MDFLDFTRCIKSHGLKATNMREQVPLNIAYPRKRS